MAVFMGSHHRTHGGDPHLRLVRSHLTYANVISTLCLVLIVGGGVAYAANTVFSADIADGEVKTAEVATAAVRTEEIANGQVEAADLAPGVTPGASGARAWGLVSYNGVLLRSKQITTVTYPTDGSYCIDPAPGINPQTAVMVVSTVFEGRTDATNDNATHAEWDDANPDCPPTAMQVRTFYADGEPPTLTETDRGGFDVFDSSERFSFVIP